MFISETNRTIRAEYLTGEKTAKEKENWIEWDVYLKKLKEMEKFFIDTMDYRLKVKKLFTSAEYKSHQKALVFFLYGVRTLRNDYRTLKISNYDREKDNYYNIETGEVVLNEYKNSKNYGQVLFKVPDKLVKYIKQLVSVRPMESDYLFIQHDGSPMLSCSWSSYLLRVSSQMLGYKVGAQMLRKSYITWKHQALPTLREMEEEAGIMGHSLEVELLVYNKK